MGSRLRQNSWLQARETDVGRKAETLEVKREIKFCYRAPILMHAICSKVECTVFEMVSSEASLKREHYQYIKLLRVNWVILNWEAL